MNPKSLILARRASFIAAGLATLASAGTARSADAGLDGSKLDGSKEAADARADQSVPQPCLAPLPPDYGDDQPSRFDSGPPPPPSDVIYREDNPGGSCAESPPGATPIGAALALAIAAIALHRRRQR